MPEQNGGYGAPRICTSGPERTHSTSMAPCRVAHRGQRFLVRRRWIDGRRNRPGRRSALPNERVGYPANLNRSKRDRYEAGSRSAKAAARLAKLPSVVSKKRRISQPVPGTVGVNREVHLINVPPSTNDSNVVVDR